MDRRSLLKLLGLAPAVAPEAVRALTMRERLFGSFEFSRGGVISGGAAFPRLLIGESMSTAGYPMPAAAADAVKAALGRGMVAGKPVTIRMRGGPGHPLRSDADRRHLSVEAQMRAHGIFDWGRA